MVCGRAIATRRDCHTRNNNTVFNCFSYYYYCCCCYYYHYYYSIAECAAARTALLFADLGVLGLRAAVASGGDHAHVRSVADENRVS